MPRWRSCPCNSLLEQTLRRRPQLTAAAPFPRRSVGWWLHACLPIWMPDPQVLQSNGTLKMADMQKGMNTSLGMGFYWHKQ